MPRAVLAQVLVAALAAAAVAAGPASAEPVSRARLLAEQGRAFHEQGDYEHAIASYQEAYALTPSPGLLFNLGQAYRLKGDCANAAGMYRSYLRTGPAPAYRQLVQGLLITVERCAPDPPVTAPVLRKPSVLRPSLASPTSLESQQRARPAGMQPTPGRALQRASVVVAVGGGVLLGFGGYFALQAASTSDLVAQRYRDGIPWRQLEALDARGRHQSSVATVLAVGGGAALVTGGLLYWAGYREAARARPTLGIDVEAHGGKVRVSWRF